MTVATGVRRVATYERVSSEDQRERETIKTQTDEIARRLALESDIVFVGRFADDGVSGAIPLLERPGGAKLMRAAAAGLIDEVHVLRLDRLGRDEIDRFVIRRRLKELNVRLVSMLEGVPDDLTYGIHTVIDAEARRRFLELTALGMARAARAGRYCGGIKPFGYRVEGVKETAHLMPDETLVWGDLSAAALVRDIYERLALRGQSCRVIATEFNSLGIPTSYALDGREVEFRSKGLRKARTQNVWRAGRIRNLVVNPVYRGELQYGRRIDQRGPMSERRGHEIISAQVEPLVSPALWDEAQAALARNRRCAKNTNRVYLLKSVVRCAVCNLTYVGSWSQDVGWYRCGGQLAERGSLGSRCPACSVRADRIEPLVWADIEAWLRNPDDVIDELDGPGEREVQSAIAEAESITLARALADLEQQRKQAVNLNIRGRLPDPELDEILDRIDTDRASLQARVAALEPSQAEIVPQQAHDLLEEVRARLDEGLTDEQRQEIVRLLVGIVIHTEVGDDGKKSARAVVTYRFPAPPAGVSTCTGTGSWPPGAGTWMGRRRPARRERSLRGRLRSAVGAPPM
jgi:site-specific DNA recombinase